MDKILNLMQNILPLIVFYPRWAQILFFTTFTLFLISMLIFVLLFSTASELKGKSEASKEFPPHVRQQIDADISSVESSIAELGLSLSNYYSSSISLRLHLLDYTKEHPDVQTYMGTTLPEQLKADTEEVIRKIEAIQVSLTAIQRSEFTSACWRRAASSTKVGALRLVRDELLLNGFTESEATIEIQDIPNLIQFFSVAASRLRQFTFAPLLTAVLSTNSADIQGVGQAYDHAGLRSLVFSGNLVFAFVGTSKADPRRSFVASWGSAILLDMVRAMPNANAVRDEVIARFPKHATAIETLRIGLSPENLIGNDLQSAVVELEKRLGLLFLKLPIDDV